MGNRSAHARGRTGRLEYAEPSARFGQGFDQAIELIALMSGHEGDANAALPPGYGRPAHARHEKTLAEQRPREIAAAVSSSPIRMGTIGVPPPSTRKPASSNAKAR